VRLLNLEVDLLSNDELAVAVCVCEVRSIVVGTVVVVVGSCYLVRIDASSVPPDVLRESRSGDEPLMASSWGCRKCHFQSCLLSGSYEVRMGEIDAMNFHRVVSSCCWGLYRPWYGDSPLRIFSCYVRHLSGECPVLIELVRCRRLASFRHQQRRQTLIALLPGLFGLHPSDVKSRFVALSAAFCCFALAFSSLLIFCTYVGARGPLLRLTEGMVY